MPSKPLRVMKFSVSRAKDAHFATDGLRDFFEYRDLGIPQASDGKFNAHVIRARQGTGEAHTDRHLHDLDFQMVYVLRGWVRFEYEGVGEVLLEAGDCVHQPPGITHTERGHSEDLEMLEITAPAVFATRSAEARPS